MREVGWRDGASGVLAGVWVLRGLGWLAPWSTNAGRVGYASLESWGSQDLGALMCALCGACVLVGLWRRMLTMEVLGLAGVWFTSATLAVGFALTGTDPPASMYAGQALMAFVLMWGDLTPAALTLEEREAQRRVEV